MDNVIERDWLLLMIKRLIRECKEGDLVLKKILPFKDDPLGNFKPNYEGPYLVSEVLSGGALFLSEMDDVLLEPFNSGFINIFYVLFILILLMKVKAGHFSLF